MTLDLNSSNSTVGKRARAALRQLAGYCVVALVVLFIAKRVFQNTPATGISKAEADKSAERTVKALSDRPSPLISPQADGPGALPEATPEEVIRRAVASYAGQGVPLLSAGGAKWPKMFVRFDRSSSYIQFADGSGKQELPRLFSEATFFRITPDGSHVVLELTLHGDMLSAGLKGLAASLFARIEGVAALVVCKLDGSSPLVLDTQHPASLQSGTFSFSISPDSSAITYQKWVVDNWEIFSSPLNVSAPRQLTDSPANDWDPRWCDGGRRILFQREGHRVFSVGLDGRPAREEALLSGNFDSESQFRFRVFDLAPPFFGMLADNTDASPLLGIVGQVSHYDGARTQTSLEWHPFSRADWYPHTTVADTPQMPTTGNNVTASSEYDDHWYPRWDPSGAPRLFFLSGNTGVDTAWFCVAEDTSPQSLASNDGGSGRPDPTRDSRIGDFIKTTIPGADANRPPTTQPNPDAEAYKQFRRLGGGKSGAESIPPLPNIAKEVEDDLKRAQGVRAPASAEEKAELDGSIRRWKIVRLFKIENRRAFKYFWAQ